jgi:HEAT repeat protein
VTMEAERIVENAIKQGFDNYIVRAALLDTNFDALETFIEQLNQSQIEDLRWEVTDHLMSIAETQDAKIAARTLSLVLEISCEESINAISALGKLGTPEAIAFIRRNLTANWREMRELATSTILQVQYDNQHTAALQDHSELVRQMAARRLENEEDADALIQALGNDSISVRRIAAWYMGRRLVKEAVTPLIKLLETENDMETLRAAIWSLGVLRNVQAISHIQALSHHQNLLISVTAQEALTRLIN